jgi:hypothetical protein
LVYFDVIGDYRALLVPDRLDLGNSEAQVVKFRESFLESVVQLVFESGSLLGRRKDTGVNAIGFVLALILEEHDLPGGIRGEAHLRLVVEPGAGGGENKKQDEDDGGIILPSSTFIGPEKRF